MPEVGGLPTPASLVSTAERGGFPLLLATLRAADTRPATRVVKALAAERGAVPHVLRVHEVPAMDVATLGYPADAYAGAPPDAGSVSEDLLCVTTELDAVGSQAAAWPVRVEVGAPGVCIICEAARLGAALIVVGLRPHGRLDRALGDDTAVHVMRRAACPVLAVANGPTGARVSGEPATLAGLPRRVLVGVDFTRASARAAHAALAVVGDGGTLVLAHVLAPSATADAVAGATLVHTLEIERALAELVAELTAAVPAGRAATFETVCMPGVAGDRVAHTLLGAADRAGADVVAVATQRLPRLERFFLGSVTIDLARAGRHSLLVVPPGAPG